MKKLTYILAIADACIIALSHSKCYIPSATFQVPHALEVSHSIHLTNYRCTYQQERQGGVMHAGTYTPSTS